MTAAPVPLTWRRRDPPLSPSAVVARGDAVAGLAAATAKRVVAGAELRVSASEGWLLVLGEPADLPWAEGVSYLGWDEGLLLPTTRACHPPADLVRAALLPQLPTDGGLVVLLGGDVLVSAVPARVADPAQLVAKP